MMIGGNGKLPPHLKWLLGGSFGLRTESAINIEHCRANEQRERLVQEREGMSETEESSENRIIDVSVIDPVCGMAVNPLEARGKAQYEGQTYYFCSPGCMHKFVSSPAKHLSAAKQAQSEPAPPVSSGKKLDKDPVCGMNVDASKAAASVEYEGKLYHFCSRGCAEKFKGYPEKYLSPNYKAVGMRTMVQIGGAPVQIDAGRKRVKDPVCGMSVDPAKAAATAVHEGKTYYFCSPGCGEKFKADPQKYLSAIETPKILAVEAVENKTASAPTGTSYVCPMDPEVRQPTTRRLSQVRHGAGARHPRGRDQDPVDLPHASGDRSRRAGCCPICGMALEPKTVTSGAGRESRTTRHDTALLDQRAARRSAGGLRDVAHGAAGAPVPTACRHVA